MTNSQPSTQGDLKNLETRIDKKFDQFGEQIIDAIDQFYNKLDNKIDQVNKNLNGKIDLLRDEMQSELGAIKKDIGEIKDRLTSLEKRTIEDSNAFGSSIVELKKEIRSLNQRVKTLEQQKA